MLSRARVALIALLLLLVTAGQAAGVATAVSAPSADRPAQTSDDAVPDPSQTTFHVQLRSNGDARWTVRMNFSLASADRQAAFERFAAEFVARSDSRTETAFRQASQRASDATGRPMSITNVERTSTTTGETGQLVLTFTWTNFARQSNSSLHVDDVFTTTSGTWLGELYADQSLVIAPPKEYSLVDAEPPGYAVSNGSLQWDGERTFAPGDISVTYEEVNSPVPGDPPLWIVALVVTGLGVVAALAFLFSNAEAGLPVPLTAVGDDDDDDDHGRDDGSPTAQGGTPTAPPADDATDATEEVDEELLSDEERIERLLDRNGGRMKQANIVTETGWSNAKVSQLLSAMDEDGRIDKLRIGRENLISFPDEDVTETNGDES